jgi:hypothetical protein
MYHLALMLPAAADVGVDAFDVPAAGLRTKASMLHKVIARNVEAKE